MNTTKIEWTDKTWNLVAGCTKLSAGCVNRYAEVMARRLQAMRQEKYKIGITVENQVAKKRIDYLRTLNTPIRFLSCEPLLENLDEMKGSDGVKRNKHENGKLINGKVYQQMP